MLSRKWIKGHFLAMDVLRVGDTMHFQVTCECGWVGPRAIHSAAMRAAKKHLTEIQEASRHDAGAHAQVA